MNSQQQKQLLVLARNTLNLYISSERIFNNPVSKTVFKQKSGVFITLNIGDNLRGCIGHLFCREPLYKEVISNTINAAVHDDRFPPVSKDELDKIRIEISLLTKPVKINNWKLIKLGKHGVIVKRNHHVGTFLPQVAQETGWSLEEFMAHLCRDKAGLPPDAYKSGQTEIFVYTAQVFGE